MRLNANLFTSLILLLFFNIEIKEGKKKSSNNNIENWICRVSQSDYQN